MAWEGSTALIWSADRLRTATTAAGIALWSWDVDSDEIALDERACRLWGVPSSERVTFADLSACIHPADLERVQGAFEETRAKAGPYEIDFRILHADAVRWVSARGQGGDEGIDDRNLFGVFLDVTARKEAEQAREMLAGEMSHRVKNLFSIVTAMIAIAVRSAATTAEMARDLTQRLLALGRAHELVRPVPGENKDRGALLGDMLTVLLAPYADDAVSSNRVVVAIPMVRVGGTAATTLALIVHEFATNSLKYGALSHEGGTVGLTGEVSGGEVVLVWTEQGGPVITATSKTAGYGTRLVTRSVSGQLGGTIGVEWRETGMIATLRMSMARLAT